MVAETEGCVLLFVGERRSGKTSILFQILNGRLGVGFLPIFVDMQAMAGVSDDREFFVRLAEATCSQVGHERIRVEEYGFQAEDPSAAFSKLLDDIHNAIPDRRIVYLVDEAELLYTKVETNELSGRFLIYLASILESRSVSFFFTGSRGLGESPNVHWRRLIGKAAFRVVGFLSEADARGLIQRPLEGRVSYAEGVVAAIFRLTSGHPYYTQVICTQVVDHLNAVRRNTLETYDLEEIVGTIVDNPPPNMVYSWDELGPHQQITLSLLSDETRDGLSYASAGALSEAIQQNRYPLRRSAESLHGILESLYDRDILEKDRSGNFRFRVDLFRRWIQRSRSIWQLVSERRPRRSRLAIGLSVAVVLLAIGVFALREFWTGGGEQQGAPGGISVKTGEIWVESNPPDVALFLNNEMIASRTPFLIRNLEPAGYKVELRRDGFRAWQESLAVQQGRTDTVMAVLARQTGRLTLIAEPAGARVTVGGPVDKVDAAPIHGMALPVGGYDILVVLPGYVSEERRVEILDDRITELTVRLKRNIGDLFVESSPTGARVTLDGKHRPGMTPILLKNLPVGEHSVELHFADHKSLIKQMRVRLGSRDTLSATLAPLPASFEIGSVPSDAEVYLGGAANPAGRTPLTLSLSEGEYTLRLTLEGYAEQQLTQKVRRGKTYQSTVTLDPEYGWVRILRPLFGTIWIDDGTEVRVPPGTLRLQVGRHILRSNPDAAAEAVSVLHDDTLKVSLP